MDISYRSIGDINMTFKDYVTLLKKGNRVIETGNNCMHGRCGTIYLNKSGDVCVMWDKAIDEDGYMGTSVTAGTRLLCDVRMSCLITIEN